MKKFAILFSLLLVTVLTFGQTMYINTRITGLGEFCFGMKQKKVIEKLKNYIPEQTQINNSDYLITVSHFHFEEFIFTGASFFFYKEKLCNILLSKYAEEENAEEELRKIILFFEEKYGKLPNMEEELQSAKEKKTFSWMDPKIGWISVDEKYNNKLKKTEINIFIQRSL